MNSIPLSMSNDVIDAINGELCYQATLPVLGRADSTDYGVEGQLVTLSAYTQRAIDAARNK